MQRFVAVGGARFTVLEAIPHDREEAARLATILDQHRPQRLLLAMSTEQWRAMQKDPRHLSPWEKEVVLALMTVMHPEPNAVWQAALDWATRRGVKPVLLGDTPEPPAKGTKATAKLLRKEGFDADSPKRAIERLHGHYVRRVAPMVEWVSAKRDTWAAAMRRARDHELRAVVLFASPDAEPVCERLAPQA